MNSAKKKAMCEAHAEWFGELLKELATPIARDFMLHGIKHGQELAGQPSEPLWQWGIPPIGENVYIAMCGNGYVSAAHELGYWDGKIWRSCANGGALFDVVGWHALPKWEVSHG